MAKKYEKVTSIRQRMIDRIVAENELLHNLANHYGIDVNEVKVWLKEHYTDDMLRSIIVGLDRLEKIKEDNKPV